MLASLNDFNAGALVALGYRTIEIHTALTPPITIDLLNQTGGSNDTLMRALQPAIVLNGNLGRVEIAPYGMPSGISPEFRNAAIAIGLGLGASLLGVMFFGGAIFGKKSTPPPSP